MVEFIRRIGHQVGVVVGRLNQYGLASGPQGLKLILEPDAVTVAPDDVGEPFGIAKGHAVPGRRLSSGLPLACRTSATSATGYTSSGTILVPWSSGRPVPPPRYRGWPWKCRRREGWSSGRPHTRSKRARFFEIVLDRRTGSATMRQDACDAAVGEYVNRVELSLGRGWSNAMWKVMSMLTLAFLGRAARSHHEGAKRKLVAIRRTRGLQQPKTKPSTPALTARPGPSPSCATRPGCSESRRHADGSHPSPCIVFVVAGADNAAEATPPAAGCSRSMRPHRPRWRSTALLGTKLVQHKWAQDSRCFRQALSHLHEVAVE